MENLGLSKTEQELLDLISATPDGATIGFLENALSPKHIGALGRLIGKKLIESKKERQGEQKYGAKYIKIYSLIKEEK